ncbi:MAG: AMP-binding protein [Myxococcaceae bacterium]|nr:AMP-binding protein [Myxococcaceae bacterium]
MDVEIPEPIHARDKHPGEPGARPWLKSYPRGVPADIDPDRYRSIVHAFHTACDRFRQKPCFTSMGVTLSFLDVQAASGHFAAFLRHELGLAKGDRIALQLGNVLQYPVALFGALRAGLVVVNTNPLYTPREMEHQFRDAGVKAVVILSPFAHKLRDILPALARALGGAPSVIITQPGDLFPAPKRLLVNLAVRYLRKGAAPAIPGAISFRDALARGRRHPPEEDVELSPEDIAFLQYTGGTTGVPKGAMLTHRNLIANMEQAAAWMASWCIEGKEVIVTPLPLYHSFALTVNCLVFMKYGAQNILVPDARDTRAFVRLLQKQPFTLMTAVSTLLNKLLREPGIQDVDFSRLKFTVAGGMALQRPVAERWRSLTKTPVIEGYGLTEASPVVCCNPVDGTERLGTIGLPFPSTGVRLVDEDGHEVDAGKPGELIVRGPQVMKGYWKQPAETAKVLLDGWLRTGDIAQMDEDGFFRIIDRKKDMIVVSGLNVYPNEVEEVATQHPGVVEAGAIGIPDEESGEVVKLVVVSSQPGLTGEELIQFCRERLAGYKVPKSVEFRTELPHTNIGKVLRRELR